MLLLPLPARSGDFCSSTSPPHCSPSWSCRPRSGWRQWKQRGLVNTVSGLPNLSALRANKAGRDQALIAARILNYAEIAAALPPEQERLLVEQIVSRLRVGAPDRTLVRRRRRHLRLVRGTRSCPSATIRGALRSVPQPGAGRTDMSIDLSISFGVEIGSSRSLTNRLGERARRGRRSRARRAQVEILRSGSAGRRLVEAVDAQPARRAPSTRARSGSPTSPSST